MITITRSLARQVRAVMRRAFGSTSRSLAPAVLLESGPEGLLLRAKSYDMAVEYRVPGDGPAETMAVPVELLQDCESSKHEPVQLKLCGKRIVEAAWQDGSIPQVKQYDVRKPEEVLKGFPTLPDNLAENPHRLFAALKDATETSNPNPLRFATNMLQLRGATGSVGATDGHHLLVQRGFSFPWTEDLLIPASKVFGAKELAGGETVYIGRTDNWVSLVVGDWTFHFAIEKVGRFPHLDDHIQPAEIANTRLQLSDADAPFLTQALDRLPCQDETFQPVTLELNGQVIIRAKSAEHSRVTELILIGSQSSGAPVVLNSNRKFLARAIRLGFREVLVYGADRPLQCQDGERGYVWMPLSADDVIKAGKDPIRIESPSQDAVTPSPQPKQQRKQTTMPRRKTTDYGVVPAGGTTQGTSDETSYRPANGAANGAGSAQSSPTNGEPATEVSLIDQAEAVRTSLRQSQDKVSDLIASLKRHRKQSQLVRSTLSTLKQLQTLDA